MNTQVRERKEMIRVPVGLHLGGKAIESIVGSTVRYSNPVAGLKKKLGVKCTVTVTAQHGEAL